MNWVRLNGWRVTALLVPLAGVAIGGCSAFESATSAPGSGDAGPFVQPTEAQFNVFNNSPNLSPVRLCFKYGDTVLSLPPLPADAEKPMPNSNYPGVAEGAAVALRAIDLAGVIGEGGASSDLEVFAVRAQIDRVIGSTETAGERCPDLICAHGKCLQSGADYVSMGHISSFLGSASALTITGCPTTGLGAPLADTALCGTSYTAERGNVAAHATLLNKAVIALSNTMVSLLDVPPEGSRVGWRSGDAETPLGTSFTVVTLPPSLASYATYGVAIHGTSDAGSPPDAAGTTDASNATDASSAAFFSLATIQELSDPSSVPNTFFGPGPYVFAILGSPKVGPLINADGTRNTQPFAQRVVALRLMSQ